MGWTLYWLGQVPGPTDSNRVAVQRFWTEPDGQAFVIVYRKKGQGMYAVRAKSDWHVLGISNRLFLDHAVIGDDIQAFGREFAYYGIAEDLVDHGEPGTVVDADGICWWPARVRPSRSAFRLIAGIPETHQERSFVMGRSPRTLS